MGRNFLTIYLKTSQIKTILNSFLETVHLAVFLPNALIVLIEIFLNDLFSKKDDSNGIDVLPKITKQYNNRVHSSTKLTPNQASLKKNEGLAYKNLLDSRRKKLPKFQINNRVRTTDSKKNFQK